MHKISYILVVIIVGIFLYTGIYGCGCNEKFEITEYKKTEPNTPTMLIQFVFNIFIILFFFKTQNF